MAPVIVAANTNRGRCKSCQRERYELHLSSPKILLQQIIYIDKLKNGNTFCILIKIKRKHETLTTPNIHIPSDWRNTYYWSIRVKSLNYSHFQWIFVGITFKYRPFFFYSSYVHFMNAWNELCIIFYVP